MAKYIDRDTLADYAYLRYGGFTAGEIMRFPTADVELVRHEFWIYDGEDRRCSGCKAIIEKDEWLNHNWYFCYHCGAKMDKEEEK